MHSRRFIPRAIAQASIRELLIMLASLLGYSRPLAAQGSAVIITGVVKGTNGAILAGALVSAMGADSGTHSTATNDNGKYTLIFSNGGAAFRVTVKATGYAAWTGDVKRAYTDDRIVADVTLRAGGTSADWPTFPHTPAALRFTRTQLGAADAIDVTSDVGDIAVVATTTDQIVLHAYPRSIVPGDDTSWTMPAEIAPPGTYSFGSGGMSIVGGGGVSLMIEVPRDLKSLKVTITGRGAANVAGGFMGQLSIESVAGPVLLNQVGGPAVVEARNGNVRARILSIPATLNILGRNGDITVEAPADVRASVRAEVHQGAITLDSTSHFAYPPGRFKQSDIESFRRDVPPADPANKLAWILGGGGASITLTTLNGNVIVRRAQPKPE